MNKCSLIRMLALLVISTTIITACGGQATQAPVAAQPPAQQPAATQAASGGFNWQQLKGQKITVFLSETPMASAVRNHLKEFTDKTGIDVEYLVVAETQYWNKLTVDLSSGAGEFNVFMSGPSISWGFATAGQIQPLDPFISDPKLTPPEFDFGDFYQWAIDANRFNGTYGFGGQGKGSLWSMPIDQVNNVFTYRKDIFDKYGLKAPDTWEEWASVAKQLKDKTGGTYDGKPFYPVIQRGALDGTTMSGPLNSMLDSYKWQDFDDKLNPQFSNPTGVKVFKLYMDTIKNYGTPEWPNQVWFDVQQAFAGGQYGMVFDVGDFIPTYEKNLAGKLAYAPPPAGPDGTRRSSVWTWGLSMNSKTTGDKAKAAWLFIAWASGQGPMKDFSKVGSWPTRKSVWNDPEIVALTKSYGNGTFRDAFDAVLSKDMVRWTVTPIPESAGAYLDVVKALQDYYFGKGEMQTLMAAVDKKTLDAEKASGTLK